MDANSTPTAPAPTTTSDFGIAGSCRISRLLRMQLASSSTPGSERASEPVAIIVKVVSISVVAPSFSSTKRPGPALRHQHRGPVDLDILHFEAEFLGALEIVVNVGVVQKYLRGNAAHVQAGAAEKWVLFNDGGLQSPLARPNRRDVSARSAADDHQIIFGQIRSPRCMR